MLCFTADGVEGEDWAFVRDNGKYDSLLIELGIVILESRSNRAA